MNKEYKERIKEISKTVSDDQWKVLAQLLKATVSESFLTECSKERRISKVPLLSLKAMLENTNEAKAKYNFYYEEAVKLYEQYRELNKKGQCSDQDVEMFLYIKCAMHQELLRYKIKSVDLQEKIKAKEEFQWQTEQTK